MSRPQRNKERGASAVEFAIIAPLLFFLLLAVVDVCGMFWANLTMQYAVREGARYAVTGRTDLDPNPTNDKRYRAVIEAIKENSMGLFDQVQPRINNIQYGDPTKYNDAMFGKAGEIFVLRIDCSWPLMTPLLRPFFTDGKYEFSVAATMRNEAF
jgi:Flp pilus assembly pilin Flp